MSLRILQGGKIIRSDESDPISADVRIEDGRITAIAHGLEVPEGAECIDCSGGVLLPGLFDLHTHLREPGREDQETIASGSEAAINGGVTGIVAMPNTTPAIDSAAMVRFVLNMARDTARIPVHTAGCLSVGAQGEQMAEIADMRSQGAVMITDDIHTIKDPYLLRQALEYARDLDVIIASHCDVPQLSGKGCMNEGTTAYQLGVPGIPSCSETIAIERDLRLAEYTGGRIHIQQVSTADGVEAIRRFKDAGVRVTAEVSTHHLMFTDEDVGDYDTNFKMSPPLRSREDIAALLQGLKDGVFDVVASGHAPYTEFEKNFDFFHAPFGIIGLDTFLPGLYTHLIEPGKICWDLLVDRCAMEPRRMLGLEAPEIEEGAPADLVVFNPDGSTRVDANYLRSKSRNTPFIGRELKGSVRLVLRGNEVLLDRNPDVG